MAPEHKFATSARLCSEVLAGFADGALPLDSAAEVLRDALHILASKDVKVPQNPACQCALHPALSVAPGSMNRSEGAVNPKTLVGSLCVGRKIEDSCVHRDLQLIASWHIS